MARLVIYYLILSIIVVTLIGYVAFVQARQSLQDSAFDRLTAVANLKINEINLWVNDQLRDVLFIANLTEIQTPGEVLLTHAANDPAYQRALEQLSTYLNKVLGQKTGLQEILLVDLKGVVVASSKTDHVGQILTQEEYFQRGRALLFPSSSYVQNVYLSPTTNRPAMTIVVPFFGQEDKPLGILVAHLYLERLNRIILDRTGLGDTGETYLVDRFYQFVSEARFRSQLFYFPEGIHTVAIDKALQTANETDRNGQGLYLNYEGKRVMGVYRWLPEREMVLLAEMQTAEAFAPASQLAQVIVLIGLACTMVLAIGVYILARQIAQPILAIRETATKVAQGDLTATAPIVTEDEVGDLAISFNQMTRQLQETIVKLQELDQLKSEFLTSMSHELRTPLNAILGFADVLIEGIDGELPEAALYDIRLIFNSGQHLLAIINDILDISKIEAGMMELSYDGVNTSELVAEVVPIINSLIGSKPIELFTSIDEQSTLIYADPLRLKQILLNLLSNAVKFTSHGQVSLQITMENETDILFKVKDTGIGIPPDKQELIFEHFKQADMSKTREYGGTGLGLPISKHLVEMHGGTIQVKSVVGEGSEFSFVLPLKQS